MKLCLKCQTHKPTSAFGRRSNLPDGLQRWCKDCVNASARARDGRVAYEKPPVVFSGVQKTCFKCGVTKAIELFHKHHRMADGHLNKCGACSTADTSAWKATRPDYRKTRYARELEMGKRKRKAPQKLGINPLSRKIATAKYDVKRRAKVATSNDFDEFVFAEAQTLCYLREVFVGGKWHVDHIVPLNHTHASGLHNAFNLQVVPAQWNVRKSNKSMAVFIPST